MQKGIFTSVIRVKGSDKYNVISVKSSKPIEYKYWIDFSRIISTIYVSAPINIGDIVCKNIGNTGIDIIATCNIAKE